METHAKIAKTERYEIWALVTVELPVSPEPGSSRLLFYKRKVNSYHVYASAILFLIQQLNANPN